MILLRDPEHFVAGQLHTLGKSSICIHRFNVVNLSMIRLVYFKLNKNTKRSMHLLLTHAWYNFG